MRKPLTTIFTMFIAAGLAAQQASNPNQAASPTPAMQQQLDDLKARMEAEHQRIQQLQQQLVDREQGLQQLEQEMNSLQGNGSQPAAAATTQATYSPAPAAAASNIS